MRTFISKHWDTVILSLIVIMYSVIFSALTIARHNAFASGFDLGNMDQTVWNTLHGRFFSFTSGLRTVSRFSIHADIILAFLSPLYLVWDNVRTLLIAQSVFIGLSAVPIYYLSRKILEDKAMSLAMAVVFLLVPGVEWTNMYDFHSTALAIFFFLSAFYFAWTKNWRWYWVFAFLMLLCKETTSLTIASLGFLMIVVQREYKVGLLSMGLGLGWFVVMIKVVIPYFTADHTYWALNWTQSFTLSENPGGSSMIDNKIFGRFMLSPDAKTYYMQLLKPYAFLPLLGLPWLFVIFPRLSVNLISTQGQMRSVVFHYDSVIQAGLMIATIFGLGYILRGISKMHLPKKTQKIAEYLCVIALLAISIRVNYHYSPLPTTPSCWCISYDVQQDDREFEAVLQAIPQDKSITASPEIRPHITHREFAYTLPIATASADFIALIDQNRIVGNYEAKDFELRLRDDLNTSSDYTLVKHIGHFYLYKKT